MEIHLVSPCYDTSRLTRLGVKQQVSLDSHLVGGPRLCDKAASIFLQRSAIFGLHRNARRPFPDGGTKEGLRAGSLGLRPLLGPYHWALPLGPVPTTGPYHWALPTTGPSPYHWAQALPLGPTTGPSPYHWALPLGPTPEPRRRP